MRDIFGSINYWAVLVSGLVYWVIGMIWFSALIGKSWAEEVKKHGIKISKPTSGKMTTKSILTFILNLLTAWGTAVLISAFGITDLGWGVSLGLLLAICFAASVMITSYVWENRSFKLSFYDVFYPFIGIVVSSLIITWWP